MYFEFPGEKLFPRRSHFRGEAIFWGEEKPFVKKTWRMRPLMTENGFSPKMASPQKMASLRKWLLPRKGFSPKMISPVKMVSPFACNLLKSFPFCIHPFASSIACIFTSYYTHRHNNDNNPIKILFKSWFF